MSHTGTLLHFAHGLQSSVWPIPPNRIWFDFSDPTARIFNEHIRVCLLFLGHEFEKVTWKFQVLGFLLLLVFFFCLFVCLFVLFCFLFCFCFVLFCFLFCFFCFVVLLLFWVFSSDIQINSERAPLLKNFENWHPFTPTLASNSLQKMYRLLVNQFRFSCVFSYSLQTRGGHPFALGQYGFEDNKLDDDGWEEIHLRNFKWTIESRLWSFYFKIFDRAIACQDFLFKIKRIDSPVCCFCQKVPETIIIFFFFFFSKVI